MAAEAPYVTPSVEAETAAVPVRAAGGAAQRSCVIETKVAGEVGAAARAASGECTPESASGVKRQRSADEWRKEREQLHAKCAQSLERERWVKRVWFRHAGTGKTVYFPEPIVSKHRWKGLRENGSN